MNELVESPFAGRPLAETAGARQDQSREVADLQVTYLMAQQFPRDEKAAMDSILLAFQRALLAEQSQYEYSRGGTEIRGASIKAMQQIAVCWGNVDAAWRERSRGIGPKGVPYSEVEAVAVDLQTRTRKRISFIVPHWRDTRQGGYALKDERDIYELCANQAQRRVRACLEAVIPADVVEAAMQQADATLKAKADTSPEAMAKMVDAFATFGVTKDHIEKRIQRKLDSISPVQVVGLKRIYASLRDQMSEPAEWFEMGAPEEAAGENGATPAASGSRTGNIKDRLKAAAAKKTAAPPAPKPEPKGKPAGKSEAGKSASKASAKTDTPVATFAEVADRLNVATSADAVNVAADLIRHVADEDQRVELEELYRARMAEFDEGDAS
jgi:hypothetical protein